MHKSIVTIFLVASIVCGSYMTLAYTGTIQSPLYAVSEYPMSKEININCLSDVLNEDLYDLARDLNVHVYGINNIPSDLVILWYEKINAENGWEPYKKDDTWRDLSDPCNIQSRMWNKHLKGQIVICCSDDLIKFVTGYDVLIITSCAPLHLYNNAWSTWDFSQVPILSSIC